MNSATKFFLGSNTNEGFYSCFDELYDPEKDARVYVIKGGAGCGKSTLMCRAADALESHSAPCEYVMCASDPSSYDAIICPSKKIIMVDGTAPHVIEPKYYGVVEEIVNMGEGLNTQALRKNAEQIRKLSAIGANSYRKATNCLKASAMLMRNSKRLQDEYIDYEKLYNYVISFAKRYFSDEKEDGDARYRFYSAVTPEGVVSFNGGITDEYKQIIGIDDPIGGVSGQILDCLLTVALDFGINVLVGISPFDTEELERLMFPDFGIAIIHKNDSAPITRTIHASRFLSSSGLRLHKFRLTFNRKTAAELRDEAVDILKEAKAAHDETEKIYAECMDFSYADKQIKEVIEAMIHAVF